MTRKPTFATSRTLAMLAGAVGLSMATVALAAPRGAEYPISIADVQERAEARFQALDRDGSGELSPEEFAAASPGKHFAFHGQKRHPQRMRGADGDGAAKPRQHQRDQSAMADFQQETFARLDTDGDGQLSRDEFDAGKLREARQQVMQERLFARLDKDGSGGLSPDELPGPSKRLQAMDADGDGLVTEAEAREYRQQRREARQERRDARRDARRAGNG